MLYHPWQCVNLFSCQNAPIKLLVSENLFYFIYHVRLNISVECQTDLHFLKVHFKLQVFYMIIYFLLITPTLWSETSPEYFLLMHRGCQEVSEGEFEVPILIACIVQFVHCLCTKQNTYSNQKNLKLIYKTEMKYNTMGGIPTKSLLTVGWNFPSLFSTNKQVPSGGVQTT